MLILLPPSEGKSAPRKGAPLDLRTLSLTGLTPARESVIDALVSLCSDRPGDAMDVLGIPKTQPELIDLDAGLREAPTARVDRIYTGVLYDALDAATLPTAAKRRAAARVLVTSSVFGLVGLGDRIPAYRLSGDTTLPGLGPVQAHWRRHLPDAMRDHAGHGLVIDLRSQMYAAFWRTDEIAQRTATVRVLHETGGVRKVVSHFNKATKGRIVRALLEDGAAPRTPAALADVMQDLGWTVEMGAATKHGTQLDVVVKEL